MSTVDPRRSIARKKFAIPVKSSALHKLILEQLKLEDSSWYTDVERPRSGTFSIDWARIWSRMSLADEGKPRTKKNVEKRMAEFGKNVFDNRSKAIRRMVKSAAYQILYVITDEMIDGCVCDVSCFPIVYLRTAHFRTLKIKCRETDVQVARQRCGQFLVDVFVGGLRGKEIAEKREISRWEFLINDINCRDVTDRVNEMLVQATGEVLLMGWVGTDCLPMLKELKGKGVNIQAVTHKPSEMKAPVPKDIQQGYANLIKLLGKANVSANRELHGRALIVDNKALIGSMDLNSFSLSGEHTEFAIYTENIDTVRKLRAYFKKIFVPLKKG